MRTFSDKAQFTLREMITAISTALLIGAGVARFEFKTSSINDKLDMVIAKLDTTKAHTNNKLLFLENKLIAYREEFNNKLQAVTTSLTAIKPEEVRFRQRRR